MSVGFDYDRSRAMKQNEIKPCARCGKGVMHTGVPLLYRVTIEQMGVDARAVQRQAGLEQVLGGAAKLAFHMGPNEDMCVPIGDADKGLICHECAMSPDFTFAELTEACRPKI